MKDWAKEKKGESKKKSYNPAKRRKMYLEQKRKIQQRPEKVIF